MLHVVKNKINKLMINSVIVLINWSDCRGTIECMKSIYQNAGNIDVFLIDNGLDNEK